MTAMLVILVVLALTAVAPWLGVDSSDARTEDARPSRGWWPAHPESGWWRS